MNKQGQQFLSPDALNEEYYQISPEILSKFPKHRPPLTLYQFNEEVLTILPLFQAGRFIPKDRQEELLHLCEEGNIFVSRNDHSVYIKHISDQLDLILLDTNLKEHEIIEIFKQALPRRIGRFLEQPVLDVFARLKEDIFVLTEYLWHDPFRIQGLFRHLFTEYDLPKHEYNVGMIGLALYIALNRSNMSRKVLDRLAVGLFLHDLGLTKIPSFVLSKRTALSPDEQDKIIRHPIAGAKVCRKLGVGEDEVLQAVLEHHERMDGVGYPQKKESDQISLAGRICAIADSYSAMISERPYSDPISPAKAAAELLQDNRYDSKLTALLQRFVLGKGLDRRFTPGI
ncbi:MAG: HD-GYP domain-containing protein [Desulfovibrionales bacterium]